MVKSIVKLLNPYLGSGAHYSIGLPQLKKLLVVTVKVVEFEQLIGRSDLKQLGSQMDRYYTIIGNSIRSFGGSIDRFCGPTIIAYCGSLQSTDLGAIPQITVTAKTALRDLVSKPSLDMDIAVGICGGEVIYGRFGSSKRASVTCFGPTVQCSKRLANCAGMINLCDSLATTSSATIENESLIKVQTHWHPE